MIYAFGDHELNTDLQELCCVGRRIQIEPQVLKVLTYLVQHRDRVISRQELLERLWSNPFVVDEALGRCIRKARQAIGGHRDAPPCIHTVPRFGYRFIGSVEERDHLPIPPLPPDADARCCPACQRAQSPGDTFCPACGQRLPQVHLPGRTCPQCGTQASHGARLCPG